MGLIFSAAVINKMQLGGPQTISLEGADRYREHQLQLQVSATPTGGTLDVAIRSPGAAAFASIGSIDMTDPTKYVLQFTAFMAELKLTPSGFDVLKTYSVYLTSGAAA